MSTLTEEWKKKKKNNIKIVEQLQVQFSRRSEAGLKLTLSDNSKSQELGHFKIVVFFFKFVVISFI